MRILILLTILSLSVNADPVKDVWDWANDNPIATAAIVVGGGVTVGPIVAAYFAVPVAFAAEMLAPTAVEEVAGAAVASMYSSMADATFSPAFTVDIASIIVIIKYFIAVVIVVLLQWRLTIENVASAIDEYIDDNPEVVLPILVGGGVSTAGVILTIGAMAGAICYLEMLLEQTYPRFPQYNLTGHQQRYRPLFARKHLKILP
jgi:hypothetical protein